MLVKHVAETLRKEHSTAPIPSWPSNGAVARLVELGLYLRIHHRPPGALGEVMHILEGHLATFHHPQGMQH